MRKSKSKETRPTLSEPLVAIDLGSYSIKAIAARCPNNTTLQILGSEEIIRKNAMRHGQVINTSEVGYAISELLTKLSNRIGSSLMLTSAFTTIGGRSMRMARVPVKRMLGRKQPIRQSLLQDMEKECRDKIDRNFKDKDLTTLAIEPIEFIVDGDLQYEPPIDKQALRIEATYIAFVGGTSILENALGSFARSPITLEQVWVRPVVQAHVLLDDTLRQEGCAIIDFGDQTTTMSIYYNSHFIYSKVVPLGGYNITRDIEQCGISFNDARKIKHQYGYADKQLIKKDMTMLVRSVNDGSKMPLKLSEVADMIIPRLDEITAPLLLDLKQYEEYISNVVITGGGARLQGLISYLRQRTPLKVDFGKHYDWLADDTPEQYEAPEYSTLIGTLAMADDYRQNTTNEKPDPTGFIGLLVRIKKTLTNSQQGVIEFLSDNE